MLCSKVYDGHCLSFFKVGVLLQELRRHCVQLNLPDVWFAKQKGPKLLENSVMQAVNFCNLAQVVKATKPLAV